MTKTRTLRVSADLLDLKAALPLAGPFLGIPGREVESRLQISSPSPFHDRGSREGGVVTVTSRYTKAQRMNPSGR